MRLSLCGERNAQMAPVYAQSDTDRRAGALAFAGCMMKPKETGQLDRELQEAGKPYQKPFAQRQLPELPSPAGWQDVLQRAFLANGELEAAYDEWQAAMHRIAISSYWPNSNVTLGFEYMFSGGGGKTWDRVTTSAAFDPSATLKTANEGSQGGGDCTGQRPADGPDLRGDEVPHPENRCW